MKKTIGTIITALLIALISTICAFAASPETIDWMNSDLTYSGTYAYGGHALETGRTDITNTTDSYNVYYDFNVEKTGYYYIDTENDSYVYIPESTDSEKVYGYREHTTIGNNEEELFYLDAGETIIGIHFGSKEEDDIAIMFCGEEIVDYTIDESRIGDFIIDYDIDSLPCYECNVDHFYCTSNATITFSGGIVLEAEDISFEGIKNNPLTEGKNTATIKFLGREKVVEYTAYSIESVVESAELSNIENYLATKTDYLDHTYRMDVPNETLTVNFTDGTSTTVEIVNNCGTVTLPNGRKVEAYAGLGKTIEAEYIFVIKIACQTIESFAIEMESFTFAENLEKLNDNNKDYFESASAGFRWALKSITTNPEATAINFKGAAHDFFRIFATCSNLQSSIFQSDDFSPLQSTDCGGFSFASLYFLEICVIIINNKKPKGGQTMKKTFKILASAILVALLAFGSFSTAFAASEPKIEWVDGYDNFAYYYTGKEIKEGSNTLNFIDDIMSNEVFANDFGEEGMEMPYLYAFYYDFNVEKTGYYHTAMSDTSTGYAIPKSFNGKKAVGYCDSISYGEELDSIVYLEKGQTIMGIVYLATDTALYLDKQITVEYLGAKISSWEIDKNVLDDFVIGKNIWEEKVGEFGIDTNCKITFDSGKVFEMTEVYIAGTCSATPKAGKNTGTLNLLGNKKTVEFTAVYLKDIIKSVEVSNADRYTTFVTDYTGETRYSPLNNETVTVNYKNGTSASVQLSDGQGEIALSNGLVVPVYAGLTMNNNGKYDFVITVYDEVYSKTATTVEEGTLLDNIGYLTDDNFDALSRAGSDIITGFSYILVDPEFSSISFGLIAEDLLSIFTNFMTFLSYCFAF